MKSEWPLPGLERGLRSVAPTPAHEASQASVASRALVDGLRHDARSATHTMQGFLDLFGSGALGALSPAQEQSLNHLYQAAERMRELVETAIDLGLSGSDADGEEASGALLSSLTRSVVHTLLRDDPQLSLTYGACTPGEQPSLVRQRAFQTALRTLLSVAREQGEGRLELSLSQSDLHTTLTILTSSSEAPLAESVTQSLPAHVALTSALDELAPLLRNRDYLRLKRCEALIERQRGRLMVAPDLSRLRLMLPIQR